MGEDMITGRVTAFRKEQGFGTITLDDGRDVKFDASACTMVPSEGEPVRLRIAPAKWGGGFKAVHVEPAADAVPLAPRRATIEEQLAIVQGEHLAASLSEQVLADLVAQHCGGQLERAELMPLLDAYYAAEPARAIAEGYVRFTGDASGALAELAARVPGARLPEERPATIAEAVALANNALAAAGDARRFYPLALPDAPLGITEASAYLALTAPRAERLARVLPLQLAAVR